MSKEKQIKKVSKRRQEYLKFKPFADDLRKAESWCELDGVLNRYQTVKNLSKMGYRKASEVAREMFEEIIADIEALLSIYTDNTELSETMRTLIELVKRYLLAELKKKYTEGRE